MVILHDDLYQSEYSIEITIFHYQMSELLSKHGAPITYTKNGDPFFKKTTVLYDSGLFNLWDIAKYYSRDVPGHLCGGWEQRILSKRNIFPLQRKDSLSRILGSSLEQYFAREACQYMAPGCIQNMHGMI